MYNDEALKILQNIPQEIFMPSGGGTPNDTKEQSIFQWKKDRKAAQFMRAIIGGPYYIIIEYTITSSNWNNISALYIIYYLGYPTYPTYPIPERCYHG